MQRGSKNKLMMNPGLLAALLLVPLLLLLLLAQRSRRRAISKKIPLPPSPPKLPFIGNLHQLGSIPHRSLCELSKKHGPLMLLHLGSIPTMVVSSPKLAQEFMKSNDRDFATRPELKLPRIVIYDSTDIAFAPYGEYWKQMRRVCTTHLLSPKMVQCLRPVRAEEVTLLLERIARAASSSSTLCVTEALSSFVNNVLCKAVLGLSMSDQRRKFLSELVHKNSVFFSEVFVEDYFPGLRWLDVIFGLEAKLRKHSENWDTLLEEYIEDHVARLKDGERKNTSDLIDVLLELQEDSSMGFVLSREQIKAILMDMIAAGTDTSFTVLDWSMAELIRNPEVMKKVQDEVREIAQGEDTVEEEHLGKMSYLKAVIKEVLRLHPPVPLLLPRESAADCQIQGFTIPKQTRILINVWAIGRDEAYWEAAEEFRPERFLNNTLDYKGTDFSFTPFGAGRRICPGIHFAAAVVELALANILHRFNWKLPGGIRSEDVDMEDTAGLVAQRKQMLELMPVAMKFN